MYDFLIQPMCKLHNSVSDTGHMIVCHAAEESQCIRVHDRQACILQEPRKCNFMPFTLAMAIWK